MKLDILIVDFAMLALVFVPYLIFILIGKREERNLKNTFLEEARKLRLRLDEKDKWNNNIIGLDKEKTTLLLVQKRRTGLLTEVIDLREVRACEVLQEVQTVRIEQRNEQILQKIDLQLKLYDGSFRIIKLYDCEETYTQDYELKHAEKWNNTINSFIAFRPTINSAA